MSITESQDLIRKLNDSTTSKEEKVALTRKLASQLTDDMNITQFQQFYFDSLSSISEKDKKLTFGTDILNEIIQAQNKLRKNGPQLVIVINRETLTALSEQNLIIKYLETLLGKYSSPKEDQIAIFLSILNTGLEKLIEQKQILSGASILRTQIQKLLNSTFRSDKQIPYLKPEIQTELNNFLKDMADLREDSFLNTELLINFKTLLDLSKYDELAKILFNTLSQFPKNPVKVLLLNDLIIYSCKQSLTIKPDDNAQKKSIWMMKFLSGYFKTDNWFYIDNNTILSKEKTLQIITNLLDLFPQSFYMNKSVQEFLITIREHLGEGYKIILEQDKYLQFLGNEFLSGIKLNSNTIISPIKNSITQLDHKDKKNLFQLYSTPIWEYLQTLEKESLYVLSEIISIYSPYALETEKGNKDDITKTNILFNKLLKEILFSYKSQEVIQSIFIQIMRILTYHEQYYLVSEFLAKYQYEWVKVIKDASLQNYLSQMDNLFKNQLTIEMFLYSKTQLIQKLIISPNSPFVDRFEELLGLINKYEKDIEKELLNLTKNNQITSAKIFIDNYYKIIEYINVQSLPRPWYDHEEQLAEQFAHFLTIFIFLKSSENIINTLNLQFSLILKKGHLNSKNINNWIDNVLNSIISPENKHILFIKALKKLFLENIEGIDRYFSYGLGLDLLERFKQDKFYANKTKELKEFYEIYFGTFNEENLRKLRPLYKKIFSSIDYIDQVSEEGQKEAISGIADLYALVFNQTEETFILDQSWPKFEQYLKRKKYLDQVINIFHDKILRFDPKTNTLILHPRELGQSDFHARIRFILTLCNMWMDYNHAAFLEKHLFVPYYNLLKDNIMHVDPQVRTYTFEVTQALILRLYKDYKDYKQSIERLDEQLDELIKVFISGTLVTGQFIKLNEFRSFILRLFPDRVSRIDNQIIEAQSTVLIGYQQNLEKIIGFIRDDLEPYLEVQEDASGSFKTHESYEIPTVDILYRFMRNFYLVAIQAGNRPGISNPILINEATRTRLERLIWTYMPLLTQIPKDDLKSFAYILYTINPQLAQLGLLLMDQRGFKVEVIDTINEIIKRNPTTAENYKMLPPFLITLPSDKIAEVQMIFRDYLNTFLYFYQRSGKQSEWTDAGFRILNCFEILPELFQEILIMDRKYHIEIDELLQSYLLHKIEAKIWNAASTSVINFIIQQFDFSALQEEITRLTIENLLHSLELATEALKSQNEHEISRQNRASYHLWILSYNLLNKNQKNQKFFLEHEKSMTTVLNTIDNWSNQTNAGNLIIPLIIGYLLPYYSADAGKIWKNIQKHLAKNIKKIKDEKQLYDEYVNMVKSIVPVLLSFELDKNIISPKDTNPAEYQSKYQSGLIEVQTKLQSFN